MQWVAPSEKDVATHTLEKRLWEAADQLRANSGLTSAQYSTPVLGLIFLRFADVRFAKIRAGLEKMASSSRRGSRVDEPAAYHAEGVLYLTPNARFEKLLHLPEGANAGKAINEAMRDIEKHNPQLAGVLPKTYEIFNSTLLKELLKRVSEIPATIDYDAFGRIYEYFLGEFARTEGQRGGEFYTPSGIVVSWSKSWSPTTAASWIRPAVPAACSSRAPDSSLSIRRIRRRNSPFTGRRKSRPPSPSAA
jgi:type I restriction enzyme M protein